MALTFEGHIWHQTGKGILFQSHYWDDAMWFPKSQTTVIDDPSSLEVVVQVPEWLSKKRGVMEFNYYSEEAIKEMSAL